MVEKISFKESIHLLIDTMKNAEAISRVGIPFLKMCNDYKNHVSTYYYYIDEIINAFSMPSKYHKEKKAWFERFFIWHIREYTLELHNGNRSIILATETNFISFLTCGSGRTDSILKLLEEKLTKEDLSLFKKVIREKFEEDLTSHVFYPSVKDFLNK